MADIEAFSEARNQRRQPIVEVLIDDKHCKVAIGLAFKTLEKSPELLYPSDGCYDEREFHRSVPRLAVIAASCVRGPGAIWVTLWRHPSNFPSTPFRW